MVNFLYRLLIDTRANTYDSFIREAVKTIEEFGKWDTNDAAAYNMITEDAEHLESDEAYVPDETYFKRPTKDGNGVVYDMFMGNLHLHISLRDNEKIYSIRIKRQGENWICPILDCENGGKILDSSHPRNKYYEVYVWYTVPVLDITSASGYVYRHGNWDKYIYKSMDKFFRKIKEFTDDSKFNKEYK